MTGDRLGLIACCVLAAAVRLAAALALPDSMLRGNADPDSYARFAHTLATTGTYGPDGDSPSAFRPVGYPALLLPFCTSQNPLQSGIFFLHLLLTVLLVTLTWTLTRLLVGPEWGWPGALWVALDPALVRQSTVIMSETVFATFLVAVVVCWIDSCDRSNAGEQRWFTWATGIFLAAAAYVRPSAWAFALLMIVAFWRTGHGKRWLGVVCVAVALTLPWIARNWLVLGAPVPFTTHGGYTLWLGQNPVYYEQVVSGPHATWPQSSFDGWQAENARLAEGLDEAAADRRFRSLATQWMSNHPRLALHTMAHHWATFWTPIPRTGGAALRYGCGAYYIMLYVFAVLGWLRMGVRRLPQRALVTAVLSLTLVHAVYWSNVRMRAPLHPVLAVFACQGVAGIVRRIGRRPAIAVDGEKEISS